MNDKTKKGSGSLKKSGKKSVDLQDKSKHREMKNFIDNELGKLKKTKPKAFQPPDKQEDNIKEKLKKLKIPPHTPGEKKEDLNYVSQTKFNLKIDPNVNLNKTPEESFNKSGQSNPHLNEKNLIRNEENVTKEVLKDLDRQDNHKLNLSINFKSDQLRQFKNSDDIYKLPDKTYEDKLHPTSFKSDADEEEFAYEEEFVDDNQLSNVENEEDNKFDIYRDNMSKQEKVLQRIHTLQLDLEEETMDNMFQYEDSVKGFNNINYFAQGLYKNEYAQTNHLENKATNTKEIKTVDVYCNTDQVLTEIPKKHKVFNMRSDKKNKEVDESNHNLADQEYTPLSFESYKFFLKSSPFVEKIILNNINKFILQNPNKASQDMKPFSKAASDFVLPKDLLKYLKAEEFECSFQGLAVFDTDPTLIGFSITLQSKNHSLPVFNDRQSISLIILYNVLKCSIYKIFYSFAKVIGFFLLGETESLLVSARIDGVVDIYQTKSFEEPRYENFERKTNITIDQETEAHETNFKLFLPVASKQVLDSAIVRMHKRVIEIGGYNTKVYRLYFIDSEAKISIMEIRDRELGQSILSEENFPWQCLRQIDLRKELKRVLITGEADEESLKCLDFKVSLRNTACFDDVLLILTNMGLVKITIEGKNSLLVKILFSYQQQSIRVTSFDLSDTGHILIVFNDNSLKLVDEKFCSVIYQSFVGLENSSYIVNSHISKIICKNEKNKLTRKSLLANFYLLSSKNEFIIYDLNQKKQSDSKKMKKKLDIGSKKQLSKKNSLLLISETLYLDYSNYIIQTNNSDKSAEFFKLSLRKQFYEATTIKNINEKIIEKLNKI